MPVRATKRGAERTPLHASPDVLICGASFAGLALAPKLAGAGAEVLVVDRYEIGERQTSACAAPREWLVNMGLEASILQTFPELVLNTMTQRVSWELPFEFSTFDYRRLCALLWDQSDGATFETAKVESIEHGRVHTVHTDRGTITSPLVVDALGWRRVLGTDMTPRGGTGRLSRGLEVHPGGTGTELELWIDPTYVRAGYAWRFPAGDEQRIGIGSFEPSDHIKDETVQLTHDIGETDNALEFQGNWIPHKLRPATDAGVFFVGDSAGHCLPMTAEGIRTAFYFAIAAGREIRLVLDERQTREQALQRYAEFSDAHAQQFRWLLNLQHLVGRITHLPLMDTLVDMTQAGNVSTNFFRRYLNVAPPSFALETPS